MIGAVVTRYWTQDPNERLTSGFELKAGFGGLFMLALGPAVLWVIDGAEVLGTPIGTRVSNLVLLGWIHLSIAGLVTGLGVIAQRRVFGPTRVR